MINSETFSQNEFGVWANENCEVLRTKEHCLFFERIDSFFVIKYFHFIEKNNKINCTSYGEIHFLDTAVKYKRIEYSFDSILNKVSIGELNNLTFQIIGKKEIQNLSLVERISIVEPYEMKFASKESIGKQLQEWMLGIRLEAKKEKDLFRFSAGTNMHSFMFDIQNGFVYCRAARIKSTNQGTLFAQNIRLYNDGKYKDAIMKKNNYEEAIRQLVVNEKLFNPYACVYDANGFYWSLIRYDVNQIVLNGCNGEYIFYRQGIESNQLLEWFKLED